MAPSPSTAKDYLLHTKKYKYAFDSTIQCLQERFDQNTAGKKIVSFGKEFFFHGNVFGKDFFHDFANFSISENILKFTLFRNVLFPLNEKYSGL